MTSAQKIYGEIVETDYSPNEKSPASFLPTEKLNKIQAEQGSSLYKDFKRLLISESDRIEGPVLKNRMDEVVLRYTAVAGAMQVIEKSKNERNGLELTPAETEMAIRNTYAAYVNAEQVDKHSKEFQSVSRGLFTLEAVIKQDLLEKVSSGQMNLEQAETYAQRYVLLMNKAVMLSKIYSGSDDLEILLHRGSNQIGVDEYHADFTLSGVIQTAYELDQIVSKLPIGEPTDSEKRLLISAVRDAALFAGSGIEEYIPSDPKQVSTSFKNMQVADSIAEEALDVYERVPFTRETAAALSEKIMPDKIFPFEGDFNEMLTSQDFLAGVYATVKFSVMPRQFENKSDVAGYSPERLLGAIQSRLYGGQVVALETAVDKKGKSLGVVQEYTQEHPYNEALFAEIFTLKKIFEDMPEQDWVVQPEHLGRKPSYLLETAPTQEEIYALMVSLASYKVAEEMGLTTPTEANETKSLLGVSNKKENPEMARYNKSLQNLHLGLLSLVNSTRYEGGQDCMELSVHASTKAVEAVNALRYMRDQQRLALNEAAEAGSKVTRRQTTNLPSAMTAITAKGFKAGATVIALGVEHEKSGQKGRDHKIQIPMPNLSKVFVRNPEDKDPNSEETSV